MNTEIEKQCLNCGKTFIAKSIRGKYCSSRCKEAYRLSQLPLHKGICPGCGKEFEYKLIGHKQSRYFCSTACQLRNTVPTKICTCIDCGKQFEFKGRTTKLRCTECRKKKNSLVVMQGRQRRDPSVQIGVGSGGGQNRSDGLCEDKEHVSMRENKRRAYAANPEKYRQAASYKYRRILTGHDVCEVCGYDTFQQALVVHHKDMDRTNNKDVNLAIICSNCHAVVHDYIRKQQKKGSNSTEAEMFEQCRHMIQTGMAEVKSRNKAGTPDGVIRTEGCGEPQSGATHTDTSRPDMSRHEAVKGVQMTLL